MRTSTLRTSALTLLAVFAQLGSSALAASGGTVTTWGAGKTSRGGPDLGQGIVPAGLSGVQQVSAGCYHSVAVKVDGTVVAWGSNVANQISVPAGLAGVTQAAAGAFHTVVRKGDGTVVAWGRDAEGQTLVPVGLSGIVQVAAGSYHTVALRAVGTAVAWGWNDSGQCNVPVGLTSLTQVSAGAYDTIALRSNGTVAAWGFNGSGQTDVPAGLSGVTQISAGSSHNLVARSDGSVVAWGSNAWGQASVPAGLTGVTQVAGGTYHSVALKGDGTVAAWGGGSTNTGIDPNYGQSMVPAGLVGVTQVAAGAYHTMALQGTDPTIASISPSSGPLGGGTTITITGTNFAPGATTVTIGGSSASGVVVSNSKSLTAVTPAGTAGAKNVVVSTANGSATRIGGFTYLAAPTAGTVSPTQGPLAGGTVITITGSNFVAGATTVTVGGTAATSVNVTSATSLTAVTPAGTAGAKNVVVATAGGSATKPGAFTYVPAPTITSVTPASGPFAGGTTVTVVGSGFVVGATTLTIGGAPATGVSVTSATSLTAVTPPGTSGAKTVVVTTPGGSATLAGGFSYVPAPSISTVAPASGPVAGGTTITVTGTNFVTGATTVTVGGSAATSINVTSATSLTAITPAGIAGVRDVAVATVHGSATKTGAFTYLPLPTIASVTPLAGPLAGGTTITILGTGFVTGATTVTVGGAAATSVSVTSATSLTAVTPAGTAGAKTVSVSTAGGSVSLAGAFTYLAPPTILTVNPAFGSLAGGTSITVTGTNFFAGMTSLTVGGNAATLVTVTSGTSLTAVTPAGTAGAKTVSLTAPGGSTSKAGAFTYVPAPTIDTVTPNVGPLAGGTLISITGTGFVAGSTVSIGGFAAKDVTVIDSTWIMATTGGATSPGAKNVVITTAGGSATKVGGFTYDPATVPTVTGVSPNVGPTSGGTMITVTGTDFLPDATVAVDGVPATNVTVVGATMVTAKTPVGSAGPKHVTVKTGGFIASSKLGGFSYIAPPTITAVSPISGPASGGTVLTILGTNLTGASVTVGGASATNVLSTPSSLTATTPPGTIGARDLVVTTIGGTATRTGGFTYTASLAGGNPGGMPAARGSIGPDGPSEMAPPQEDATIAVTLDRCVELIRLSGASDLDCSDRTCEPSDQTIVEPTEQSPTGPDLDGNGVPDLCQLRCGDLDMDGNLGMGDLSMLLSMFGEEPVFGIGDLDSDGDIDAADLEVLRGRLPTPSDSRAEERSTPPAGDLGPSSI